MTDHPWWTVAGLTAGALALRLAQLDQSLFADELFLHAIVTKSSLGDVLDAIHDTESTPPLHFLLAWATAKLGDPATTIRIPSLVAGTAMVPATFALGRRIVGDYAALLGAALIAIAPFGVLYGVEARAYSTLGLLSALSTLALLRALDQPRWPRWLLFAALSLAILYTHYTGIFVVFAQGAWAAWRHRDRLRELGLAYAGVALAYIPWIPSFLIQRKDSAADRIERAYDLTPESIARAFLDVLPGEPFVSLRELPGRAWVAIFVIAVVLAAALAVSRRRRAPALDPRVELLAVVALATPVGAILYSLGPESVFLPRNLIASLPAAALLLGLAITRAGRVAGPVIAAVALTVLAIGTAKSFDPDHGRPDYKGAADFVEERGEPGDPVLEVSVDPRTPLGGALGVHLDDSYDFARVGPGDASTVARGRERGRLVLVVPQVGVLAGHPHLEELRDFRLVETRLFRGIAPVAVFVYVPRRA